MGAVVDHLGQFILGVSGDLLPGRLVLRCPNLDDEVSTRSEVVLGVGDQTVEDCKPAGPAIQGYVRFIVANPDR
jgi:hypothetical protein